MMQQVKHSVSQSEKKSDETITVRLDGDLNTQFGDKLDEDFGKKKGKRAKNPTIVGWIEEYVAGERKAPVIDRLNPTPDELALLKGLLRTYRKKPQFQPTLEHFANLTK